MRILAVDDDPIILELLSQFIEIVGEHDLVTARSGQEALELVGSSSEDFDCFLFDIQMPLMDGIALTRSIRGMARHTDTPVLMLTAMSDKRYIDAAFAAGATDYVTKPFDVTELRGRLNAMSSLRNLQQINTAKVFAAKALTQVPKEKLELNDPVSIYDVDKVIDFAAMENYLAQLARGSLFGSVTFAFAIRKIEEHHRALSSAEFSFLIADVAEVISDTLQGHQFLMAYAGSGTFVCVTESGWHPDMKVLMEAINLALSRMELFDNSGQELFVRVSAGEVSRMMWKNEHSVMDAVSTAYASAEAASAAHERSMNDLWSVERRA